MKHFISIFLVAFCFNSALAQDCPEILYLQEGRTYTMKNFDKKGKHDTSTRYAVSKVEKGSDGSTGYIDISVMDKKGKELLAMNHSVRCDGNNLYFDASELLGAMGATFGLEFGDNSGYIAYPKDIKVGDELEEITVEAILGDSGLAMGTRITNRQVVAKESVTTPAGTFECYKVSFDIEYDMIVTIRQKSIEWWSEDFQLVKVENYNKKGKLVSSNVLDSTE